MTLPVHQTLCLDCGVANAKHYGHACHCVRVPAEGVDRKGRSRTERIAVGICCGRMLGAETLLDEDTANALRRARCVGAS